MKPKKIKYREYADTETGELIRTREETVPENRPKFMLLFHNEFAKLFSDDPRGAVVSYLFKSMTSDNIVITTYEDIAHELDLALSTVHRHMNKLLDSDMIRKKHNAVYMVNPNVVCKKKAAPTRKLMAEYASLPSTRKAILNGNS